MTPDTNKERADVLTELPFFLEERAGVWVVVGKCGGVAPASLHERVLWEALQEARAAKAPAAEPVAYIVRSVKRPSERGTLIHADKAGSYQRATLSLEPIYTAPPQGAAKGAIDGA